MVMFHCSAFWRSIVLISLYFTQIAEALWLSLLTLTINWLYVTVQSHYINIYCVFGSTPVYPCVQKRGERNQCYSSLSLGPALLIYTWETCTLHIKNGHGHCKLTSWFMGIFFEALTLWFFPLAVCFFFLSFFKLKVRSGCDWELVGLFTHLYGNDLSFIG